MLHHWIFVSYPNRQCFLLCMGSKPWWKPWPWRLADIIMEWTNYMLPGGAPVTRAILITLLKAARLSLFQAAQFRFRSPKLKKAPAAAQWFSGQAHRHRQQQLRSNLFAVNADSSTFLADGVLNIFGDTYSNEVDGMDAKKLANFGENLWLSKQQANC